MADSGGGQVGMSSPETEMARTEEPRAVYGVKQWKTS